MNIWDQAYQNNKKFHELNFNDLNFVLEKLNLKLNDKILEIGCGTGFLSRQLYHRGFKITGVDSSEVAINQAKSSSIFINYYCQNAIDFLTINKSKYDLIIAKYTIAFIEDLEQFLSLSAKNLTKNGQILLISPQSSTLPENKKSIAIDNQKLIQICQKLNLKVKIVDRNQDNYIFISKLTPRK